MIIQCGADNIGAIQIPFTYLGEPLDSTGYQETENEENTEEVIDEND